MACHLLPIQNSLQVRSPVSGSSSILGYSVKDAVLWLIMAVRESQRFARVETITGYSTCSYVMMLKLVTNGNSRTKLCQAAADLSCGLGQKLAKSYLQKKAPLRHV